MRDPFRLLMISAMYENGGNLTHRLLDGHPQLYVYPFESQLGTRLVQDALTSTFPVKYRWPVFPLTGSARDDYRLIIDEECKVRARTPHVSKFRHMPFDFSDDERAERYEAHVASRGRSRAANVEAFFQATFEAWHDRHASGGERMYVGYSPVIAVDGERILEEVEGAHLLHVVRNPFSAYADTKKRPVPLSLEHYMLGWTLSQYAALMCQARFPERVHILRTEDILDDPIGTLGALCAALELDQSDTLNAPSWNGAALGEVLPWGTIRQATPAANRATARELSDDEHRAVRTRAWRYLDAFGYAQFP